MTATLTQQFARYICNERFGRIDSAAVTRTRQIIAYHIGLACRAVGEGHPEAGRAVAIARELSEDRGSATVIGHGHKVSLVDAVFANCSLMRARGLDDVIFPAGIHAGLVTLPVALGIGERTHASGADLITAVVTGYEVMGKFGRFTWATDPPRRPTQPFGPFGSIATAAKLLGLDREQTVVALAYAAHTAMGLAEHDLGPVSHWYSLICRNAVTSAYTARKGAWGSPTVIEGRYGFADAFLGCADIDSDAIAASLGRGYAVMESCEKRYPGTALNQVPIELMRSLAIDEGLHAGDVGGYASRSPRKDGDLPPATNWGHSQTRPWQLRHLPSIAPCCCWTARRIRRATGFRQPGDSIRHRQDVGGIRTRQADSPYTHRSRDSLGQPSGS